MYRFLLLSLLALPLWAGEDETRLTVSVTVVRGQDTASEETLYTIQSCVVESGKTICTAEKQSETEETCQLTADSTVCWY